jgi:hypothetical protein
LKSFELDKRDRIIKFFDCKTRQVLIEKAPFLVKKIKSSFPLISSCELDSYFMVRPLYKFEWEKVAINDGFWYDYFSQFEFGQKEFYKIIDFGLEDFPLNNISNIGLWLSKDDILFLDFYSPVKPKELMKGIKDWPTLF